MAKNICSIKSFFKVSILILSLITFTSEQIVWIDYDYNEEYAEKEITKASKEALYALDLTKKQEGSKMLNYYMKVTVTPKENKPTPIVIFSPTNLNNDRQVIARVTDGSPAKLYLRQEQFVEDQDELYLKILCKEDDCGYTIRFDGTQSAEIDTNTTYSYLVSSKNKDMRFEVYGQSSEHSFLTIGVEGSSTAQIVIEGVEKQPYEYGNGKILILPLEISNASLLKIFTIKSATVGDYITLNVHIVSNNVAPDNLLYPNGPVISGILEKKKDVDLAEECFPISVMGTEKYKNINKYYLTGKIHSKYALFWLADENHEYMEETEIEIEDGFLSTLIETNGKMRYVCFEFSYNPEVKLDTVAYSLSILEPNTLESFHNFYPPQLMNQIYRRMVPKGSYAIYQVGKVYSSDKRITFNLYSRKGVAEMYYAECTTYPLCSYSKEELSKLKKAKSVNKMAIWEINNEKEFNALDSDKYVMIIYCKDDNNENKGYCEIENSIINNIGVITLVEEEKFSKYVLKGDKGSFKIDLKKAKKIRALTIDIMIYSGDVSFDVRNPVFSNDLKDEEIEFNHYKYYLSNKIFYHYNLAFNKIDYVYVDYNAELNSFFTIQYGINSVLDQTRENLTSGESYLVEIDPTASKTKTVGLENYRYKKEKPFLANFFALNCDFKVYRVGEEIPFSDGYAQEILLSNSKGYKSNKYEYTINIDEADLSNYNHKMCMLYVAGYESKDEDYKTEIVVGENVNQQVIFNKDFQQVRFLYPQADSTKDLALYINIIDQAKYIVNLYVNNNEERPLREFYVTRSQIFYIPSTELSDYCQKDTLCNIIADAQFSEQLGSEEKPDFMIEITMRQIKNTPTYLQKSQAKKDFTCGDYFYYFYMDIGKNDVGEISVNFLRDFGNLWGKIVRKDQTNIDEEANWRGKYRMPSEDWEDDLVNQYTKKLEIKTDDTQDCIEGCYLLLSIQISQIGEYAPDSKFYPFSIITNIGQNKPAYTDIPKIIIQANEYIVGNIEISENERIAQFYEIYLPHDSLSVEFDFQSEVAGLYINVGGIRPTTKNADFKLIPRGRDTLFSLSNMEIYNKAVSKKIKIPIKDSIQDLNLVIGVWTDKTDSVNSELFSLRVFQPSNRGDSFDIIEVNTDQKILCNPTLINDNQYRCLFMVTYDDEDERQGLPLLIHAASVNQSAVTNIYGSLIVREYFDEFDVPNLKKNIPTSQSAQYSTLDSNKDYIYIKLSPGRIKNYFFVNVISDIKEEIMIITTIPVYNVISAEKYEFFPNPSTEQLLSVSVDKLILTFPSSSIIANFVTLDGEANIAWENDPNTAYNLKGNGDRLSLTSGSRSNKIIITRDKEEDEEGPGFVFYISYYERNEENNFDQIQSGKPVELSYRNTSLPIYLYSKIRENSNDINLEVKFKNSDIEGKYKYPPLTVIATLAKQNTIYKAKQSPELGPSLGRLFLGTYDPAINAAQVFLDSKIISNFNIKPEDNPTLYLSVETDDEDISPIKSNKFNIEALFSQINSGVVPVEKIFSYGKVGSSNRFNFYKLKVDKNKKYMIIDIAFNSRLLDFTINDKISLNSNTSLISGSKKERGKIILTIKNQNTIQYLYLTIFKKQGVKDDNNFLFNYVFKYVNVDDEKEHPNYKILGNNNVLKYEESKKDKNGNITIKCTFNRIDIDYNKANITYFFKVVNNESLFYGESCETIALTESIYYYVYKRNPTYDSKGQITLTANEDLSNWAYLQVIAQIQQDATIDYVSYKGIENIRPPKQKGGKKESSSVAAFVIIIIVLLALVIGLAIIVFIIQQQNKSLVNQVKHISFQQNQNINDSYNADPDLLLKK